MWLANVNLKGPVLSIMLYAPLLLSLFARERGFYCFPGFCFLAANIQLRGKKLLRLVLLVSLKLAILKNVLKCCIINKARYRNKRLTTDMADANGLQRAIRPNGFFDIKKMAADFLQHAMHNGQYWVFNWPFYFVLKSLWD